MSVASPSLRDIADALIANVLIAIVSAITVLVVPKLIGRVEYGYWQMFQFLGSYVLLLQLGLADGVYLRYGGKRLWELNKVHLFPQFWTLCVFLGVIAIGSGISILFLVHDPDRRLVLLGVVAFGVIANLAHFLKLSLQCTGEFGIFRRITVFDRLSYIGCLIVFVALGVVSYSLLIGAELIVGVLALIVLVVFTQRAREKVRPPQAWVFGEMWANIRVGAQLTIANTANMLIIGTVRFSVDVVWGIAVFGAVSLVWNLSNLFMVLVNSLGLVIFPTLRRMSDALIPKTFVSLRVTLFVLTCGLLVVEPAISWFARLWLPEYADGIRYFALLMPLIVFEAKMGLVVNPFLKSLRRESDLLWINMTAVGCSAVLSLMFSVVIVSLDLLVLTILLVLGFRSIVGEIVLSRKVGANSLSVLVGEIVLVGIAALTSWYLPGVGRTIVYIVCYLIVLFLLRGPVRTALVDFGAMLRRIRTR